MIRVAIVDDHKIITDSLSEIIEKEEGISVIAKAFTIAECRKLLKSCQPDVLLLDVSLPDGNGLDFCSEIHKRYPDIKILMLTGYAEINVIGRAFDAGARGYVLKNSSSEEIIAGILAVAGGKRFMCDQSTGLFMHSSYQPISLSPRECEILKLTVEGLTMQETADKLHLSFETVRSYHKYLHLKLDVHNTAQLVRMAMEQKLV